MLQMKRDKWRHYAKVKKKTAKKRKKNAIVRNIALIWFSMPIEKKEN
jgi:hypothetical protein